MMKNWKSLVATALAGFAMFLGLAAFTNASASPKPSQSVLKSVVRQCDRAQHITFEQKMERFSHHKVRKEKVIVKSVHCTEEPGSTINQCDSKATINYVPSGKVALRVGDDFRLALVNGKWFLLSFDGDQQCKANP